MTNKIILTLLTWELAVSCASTINLEDLQIEELTNQPLQRLWGIPDVTAQIGRLFHYEIPKNAFYGNVAKYEAHKDDGSPLSKWLTFSEKTGVLEGVPSEEDLGEHYIIVKAFDENLRDFVKDIFALEVLTTSDYHQEELSDCKHDAEKILLTIVLDAEYRRLSPSQKINLIKLFSKLYSLAPEIIHLNSIEGSDKLLNFDVINAGPGNAKIVTYDTSTSLNFQVGCHGSVLRKYVPVLEDISKSSRNGTLSRILNMPVIGWKIQKEEKNFLREKREIPERPMSSPEVEERNVSPTIMFNPYNTTSNISEVDSDNEIKGSPDGFEAYISSSPTPPLRNTSYPDEVTSYTSRNTPPIIQQRLQKFSITAGKVMRYKIPNNTFSDLEDGDTRNLRLKLRINAETEIPSDFWIQFDKDSQEIYALPLEKDILKWNFELVAYDSKDLYVYDNVTIWVQDNKVRRAVNHAITIELLSVPPGISLDWELALLDAICEKFGVADPSNITVLNVTTTEPYIFSWTNDSLPRQECPTEEINHLYEVLTGDNGLKNSELNAEGLKVGNISWTGIGLCESRPPEPPKNKNLPPTARNQVDFLNATVGQLLVFSVPEDSFYDPEDGNARNLRLYLETKDGGKIMSNNWLQFDIKNQEFYGIPWFQDVGSKEYQLICLDKGGLVARDGIVVVVRPAPRVMYNVEFSMKLNMDYNQFIGSPSLQRSFVEKLAQLFGDPNTDSIVLSGLSPGSIVVTWHNKSLPTNLCPDSTIKQLRQVVLGDDERLSERVTKIMGDEFPVVSARLTPTGLCQGALIETFPDNGGSEPPIRKDVTVISKSDHYIIGLIVPLIVITVMLLCAGIVACVLYRRRRTGKMSVGDEDERQTFRSKGIPVIFQDELDERPEPTNKSPVIMKEEKPPLPPPEYQRGAPLATTALLSDTEDSPYQPPPPFTTTRDTARPKPTPTYRMPPPYVPP